MFDLVRLIYTSRAQFNYADGGSGMEPEVAEILKQSRENNRQANIGGVLYFADGYFFQCLEGKRPHVLSLVQRLQKDKRHDDFKISYFRRARRRRFNDWSMKYVPVGEDVIDLIKSRGYSNFTPVTFDESDINSVIDLFSRMDDPSLRNPELNNASRLKRRLMERLFPRSTLPSFWSL